MAAVRARAVSVPAWMWLAVIVVASAAFRIALARHTVAPWIMVDELVYSELAKSFAHDGQFLVRGVPSHGYGFVYPMLIAPAWRAFASVPDAYRAAKDINAVVMSLTAVPVFLLARRMLSPGLSLAAALLAVMVPSLLYTETLMTENAFYPLFLVVCLVLVQALERPTAARQLALLGLCGIAYATRAQAIALVPAILTAPVLHGWLERDLRVRLRRWVPLYATVAAVGMAALLATAARGRSPLSLLGAYRAATGKGYSAGTVLHYLLWHVAELDLYVGVVPFACLLALWFGARSLSPPARAFAAATLPVTVFLLVEVAAFASTESFRIEERNDFYLAPLALIALLGLLGDRVVPPGRRSLGAAAIAAGVLPVAIPFDRFVNTSAVSDTFALMPWWWVQDRGIAFSDVRYVALLAGLGAAAALLMLPRRFALVFAAVVAFYFVLTTAVVDHGRHGIQQASAGSLWAGIRVVHPDWIDRAVGHDANVAVLWKPNPEIHPIWENEFFNRSVGEIYSLGADPYDGGLPEQDAHELAGGMIATSTGATPTVRYALTALGIAGTRIGRDPRIGLDLYRVDGPLVVLTHVSGLYANDTWAGRHVTYRRVECSGGSLGVELQTDAHLFTRAQVITAVEGGQVVGRTRIPPAELRRLTVPLHPDARRRCIVEFTAATLRVPALVQKGSSDTRSLGAHFLRFDYHP